MRVVVTTEQRFHQGSDGRVVTSGPMDYTFWERYLDVFQEVEVLARVHDVSRAHDGEPAVDGPRVRVRALPAYIGPFGYLQSFRSLRTVVRAATFQRSAVIVRAPSQLGTLLLSDLRGAHSRAFGLEVVGDPMDVFSGGGVGHPLRRFFRWWFARHLRLQCRQAAAIAYVSEGAMKTRYPPRADSSQLVTAFSSIDLPRSALAPAPRNSVHSSAPSRLLTVGSLEQRYKGVDVLIHAMRICQDRGVVVSLVVVGEGRERGRLESLAGRLLGAARVEFAGQVASPGRVRPYLDRADLFVLASRTEGLPRAMIEAMARGLPCLGTDVGGMPELLDPRDLVPAGDAAALAEAVITVLADPGRMAEMSARNLAQAQRYTTDVLRPRRRAFYAAVRSAAEDAGTIAAGGPQVSL